jgi:hypothetical protein
VELGVCMNGLDREVATRRVLGRRFGVSMVCTRRLRGDEAGEVVRTALEVGGQDRCGEQ